MMAANAAKSLMCVNTNLPLIDGDRGEHELRPGRQQHIGDLAQVEMPGEKGDQGETDAPQAS